MAIVLDAGSHGEEAEGEEGAQGRRRDREVRDAEPMFLQRRHAFDPYSHAKRGVKVYPQSPMEDPHRALGGTGEGIRFVETAGTLCEDGEPGEEDLVEGHARAGGRDGRVDSGGQRGAESVVEEPEEGAGDAGVVEGGEPGVGDLDCGERVEGVWSFLGGGNFFLLGSGGGD